VRRSAAVGGGELRGDGVEPLAERAEGRHELAPARDRPSRAPRQAGVIGSAPVMASTARACTSPIDTSRSTRERARSSNPRAGR
jgi:hypothetical protein